MTISGAQVTAARDLLGWSQEKLALEAGVDTRTVCSFETGKSRPLVMTVSLIQRALEEAGVEFVDGEPGVRLMKAKP
jgi:transcriptional regulator with XRE-family HTH domain